MSKEDISLYGMDFIFKEFEDFLTGAFPDPFEGHVMLELFGENILKSFNEKDALSGLAQDMISGRFFDGNRQLKCRRIRDDLFRLVADFKINGWEEQGRGFFAGDHHIALWGYRNQGLGQVLYEERIPRLFDYPVADDIKNSLAERERLEITVKEFHDSVGSPLWDRFVSIKKWEG